MGIGFFSKQDPPDLSSPVAELVRECIINNEVVIFSKTYCPYCKMAKEVFDKLGCQYEVIELDKREDGDQIQSILELMTGARTVPRVFVDGKFIGGGNDVKRLYEDGSLQVMIRKMNTESEPLRRACTIPKRPGEKTDAGETLEPDRCAQEAAHYVGATAEERLDEKELLEIEDNNKRRESGVRPLENGALASGVGENEAGERDGGSRGGENRRGGTGEADEAADAQGPSEELRRR